MKKIHTEIGRFLVVGCTAVLTDLLVYSVLIRFMPYPAAKALSFIAGSVISYLANKFWTFEQHKKDHTEIIRFIVLYLSTLVANVLVNNAALFVFPTLVWFAFLCATGTSTILNFIGQKWWVFQPGPRSENALLLQIDTLLKWIKSINPYFVASVLLIWIAASKQFLSLTVLPEVWLENGTNFFLAAYKNSFLGNLRELDFGYLALLPRTIAYIAALPAFINHYPHITQWSGVTLLAMFISTFCLKPFRRIISSDIVRFFIAVTIGTIFFHDVEFFLFNNFAYVGFIFLIFVLYLEKEKSSLLSYIPLLLLATLLGASKSYFVVLIPLYGIMLIWSARKKLIRSTVFYALPLLTMMVQALTIIRSQSSLATTPIEAAPSSELNLSLIVSAVSDALFYYVQSVSHLFLQHGVPLYPLTANIIIIGILVVLWGIIGYWAYTKQKKELVLFFLVSHISAVLYLMLTALLLNQSASFAAEYPAVSWTTFFEFPHKRHFFIPFILIALANIAVIVNILRYRVIQAGFVIALALVFWQRDPIQIKDEHYSKVEYHGHWETYHRFAEDDEFCIPINPFPWIAGKNCTILNGGLGSSFAPFVTIQKVTELELFHTYPFTRAWKVKAITLENDSAYSYQHITLVAYNFDGQEIARVSSLNPVFYQYQYFLFEEPQTIAKLAFLNEDDEPVAIHPRFRFMGLSEADTIVKQIGNEAVTGVIGELESGHEIIQTMYSEHANFTGVSLLLANFGRENTCDVRFQIIDHETKTIIKEVQHSCSLISNDSYYTMFFDPIPDSTGKQYDVIVHLDNASIGNSITTYLTSSYIPGQTHLYHNGAEIQQSLVYQVYYTDLTAAQSAEATTQEQTQ